MIAQRHWLVCIAVTVSAPVLSPDQCTGGELDKVISVWREREAATRTVNAAMSELRTMAKGRLTGLSTGLDGSPAPLEPEKDTTKEFVRALILDGDRMLHSAEGETWIATAHRFLPEKMISVSNGVIAKSAHIRDERTDQVHSSGFIHRTAAHPDRWNHFLRPLLAHYRPFSPGLGTFDPTRWKVVDTDAEVNNASCILIHEGDPNDDRTKEFWVDPSKDMAVVLYHDRFRGRVETVITITYDKHIRHGWIPNTWTISRYSGGEEAGSKLGKLQDLFLNESVKDDTFVLEFPPSTLVSDYSTREMFIVRSDHSLYAVPVQERELSYSALLRKSEEGPAPRDDSRDMMVFSLLASLIATGVIGLLAFVPLQCSRRTAPLAASALLVVICLGAVSTGAGRAAMGARAPQQLKQIRITSTSLKMHVTKSGASTRVTPKHGMEAHMCACSRSWKRPAPALLLRITTRSVPVGVQLAMNG